MSLSQALASAVSGLRTTQAGISLVAANVANAQTPGYIRKTLNQTTTTAGEAGVSVRVAGINREIETFVQRQMRTETSGGGFADLRAEFYRQLQGIYGDPGTSSTLETQFNNFTSALQALSTSPEDSSARYAVLSSAQILTQQLNSMTQGVQSLRSDAEQGLSAAVKTANNAMQQIASINQQLATSHSADGTSAALLDQRDQYIDQLSQLMDISVTQDDFNQVRVFTGSGIQLVGLQAATLAFNAQGTMTANTLWDPDSSKSNVGTLALVSAGGGSLDLIANKSIKSGQIAAYLDMRDNVLTQAQTQLDQIAAGLASALSDKMIAADTVSAPPQSGLQVDINGLLAGNKVSLTYTDNVTHTQYHYTLVGVDDPSLLPLKNSVTSDPNDKVLGIDLTGGITSIVSQLNSKFNGKIQFSNPSGTTLCVLDDGAANNSTVDVLSVTKTITSLTGNSAEFPFFNDAGTAYTGKISSTGSQSQGLAGRLVVNAALINDPSKLVVYSSTTDGGDSTRPNFIITQLTSASLNYSPQSGIGTSTAPYSGSLQSFLRQVLSQQGDAANAASSLAQGQDVVVNALKQRISDESGVNIDTEMANLLNLQNTYAANARLLSAVKDMLDTLMRM